MDYKKISKKIFKSSPLIHLFLIVLIAASTILIYINIKNSQYLFDSFIGNIIFIDTLFYLSISVFIKIGLIIIKQLQTYLEFLNSQKLQIILEEELIEKIDPITISKFETADTKNKIGVMLNSFVSTNSFINSQLNFVHHLILILVYGYTLVSYDWLIGIFVLISIIPNIINEAKLAIKRFSYYITTTELSREKFYLFQLLTNPSNYKEIIVYSIKQFITDKWKRVAISSQVIENKFKRIETTKKTLFSFMNPIMVFIVQVYLIYNISISKLSVGEYIAITTTMGLIDGSVSFFLNYYGQFKQYKLLNSSINEVSLITNKVQLQDNKSVEEISEIRLENLNFTYPDNITSTLRDVNLEINNGDFIIILGKNGSGKSTLGKTIVGLNDIEIGEFYINNEDINCYDRKSIYQNMSYVAQDYINYPFSLVENITLNRSNLSNLENVKKFLLQYPSLIPTEMEKRLEETLGNDFTGAKQLSGGQWQRVALARALFSNRSVLVLDEATSAIDTVTEAVILRNILQQRKNKITIFITHRTAFVEYSSKIVLLENGKVNAIGTHKELLQESTYYNSLLGKIETKEEKEYVKA